MKFTSHASSHDAVRSSEESEVNSNAPAQTGDPDDVGRDRVDEFLWCPDRPWEGFDPDCSNATLSSEAHKGGGDSGAENADEKVKRPSKK